MSNFLRSTTGESLAESLIALSVLAVGITFSGVVIASSLRNVGGSRDRVTATQIAREAIEGVRNIRDTNWLRFSSDRRTCWNNATSEITCDKNTAKITAGDYLIYLNPSYQWLLIPYNVQNAPLALVDVDSALDSNGDGVKDNDADIYNHIVADALGKDHTQLTPFTRKITIHYLDNDGNVNDDPADNRMQIDSTVEWSDKIVQHVTLSTVITDYLGRDNLTD